MKQRNHDAVASCARVGRLPVVVLSVALGACADAATVLAPDEPVPPAAFPKAPAGRAVAGAAIEDAITRLLPSLEGGSSIEALEAGLSQLRTQLGASGGIGHALSRVRKALADYRQQAGAEFQPDVDAIGLALLALEDAN